MAILIHKNTANKKFDFVLHAFDQKDKFAVVNMSGFEAISKPFQFTLTLVSNDANIDFDKALNGAATFQIFASDGVSSTPYHGVLAEFEQLQQTDGYVFYRAVLVPRLWQLSLYQTSEVYLDDQTIPQIAEKILRKSTFSTADYEFRLSGSYRARSYVCQYQETYLDFLSRWMEKEGVYFFFEHDGVADKLVIVDNRSMHSAQTVKVNYRPISEYDTGTASDSVQNFVCRQRPLPKQVVLQDFNHRKANVQLKVTEPVAANGVGEVNIYGENFRDQAEGRRYAKLRVEEIICGGKVFTGEATAVGLRCGYLLEMKRHYRDDVNGAYLVTEVQHEGSQAAALLAGLQTSYTEGLGQTTYYRNTFRAIPAATQFRPERTTAKPRVIGTMNAVIDAEGLGEYAELDAYGQYKVQLPFDDSDKAAGKGSSRIRMASPYAGSDHGMNFPLQKNAEVLLSFIDGDPDQPVIMGAVPNSENPNLVTHHNPFENRIKTRGGNQMVMTDSRGKQSVLFHSPSGSSSILIGSFGSSEQSSGHDGDTKGSKEEKEKEEEEEKEKAHQIDELIEDKEESKKHAGSGFKFFTKGVSEAVTLGVKSDMTIGAKNEITLAGETSISAGVASKLSFELGLVANFGGEVEYAGGNKYIVESGHVKAVTEHEMTSASSKITMAAGYQNSVTEELLKKLKSRVLKGLTAITALNSALAAGAATELIARKPGETNEPGHEMEHQGLEAGFTAAAPVALSMLTSVPTYILARNAIQALVDKYEDQQPISTVDISSTGIIQKVITTAPLLPAAALTPCESSIDIAAKYLLLSLGSPADALVPLKKATIKLEPGSIEDIAETARSIQTSLFSVGGVGPADGVGPGLTFNASDNSVSIKSALASVKVLEDTATVHAGTIIIGHTRTGPQLPSREKVDRLKIQNAKKLASELLIVQLDTQIADADIENAYESFLATTAMPRGAVRRPVDKTKTCTQPELNLLKSRKSTAETELQSAIAAIAQLTSDVEIPVIGADKHGLSIDATSAVLQYGNGGMKASETGLSLKFGGEATMDFSAVGLALTGQLIKMG